VTGDKEKIILVGGGGHCKSCIDVIEQEDRFDIAGIVERPDHMKGENVLGYPIIGTDNDLVDLKRKYNYALVAAGQIKSPNIRIRICDRLLELCFELPVVTSPLAYASPHAQIGEGTIIMHHALVNANAKIGVNCIINTKALVEHDAVIEDHCHIATGSIVNGGVTIGSGSFFGSGAVSSQYIGISANSFIKANHTVRR
jgi:sugar O-acyltransferase (sialic acid O-acetyltransferase NeuD family)